MPWAAFNAFEISKAISAWFLQFSLTPALSNFTQTYMYFGLYVLLKKQCFSLNGTATEGNDGKFLINTFERKFAVKLLPWPYVVYTMQTDKKLKILFSDNQTEEPLWMKAYIFGLYNSNIHATWLCRESVVFGIYIYIYLVYIIVIFTQHNCVEKVWYTILMRNAIFSLTASTIPRPSEGEAREVRYPWTTVTPQEAQPGSTPSTVSNHTSSAYPLPSILHTLN